MKKVYFIIAFILIMAIFFSACSGASEQVDRNQDNQPKDNQPKEVTLKMMGWEASPLETKSVKNGLENFMKKILILK